MIKRPKPPLIVILGSTGCGKTKLSIQLAEKFNGEIISADSMQVYKSLDIVTAKATQTEQAAVPHHLLDVIEPNTPFTVVEFKKMALKVIDGLLQAGKVPIVVGGTNYYIEAILWDLLISDFEIEEKKTLDDSRLDDLESLKLNCSDTELYGMLKDVDPATAALLHPNNRRKILRALQIFKQKGISLSELLKKQHASKNGGTLSGPLRFPNAIIFWLKCNQDFLDTRLDSRVDSMVDHGLINELTGFYEKYKEKITENRERIFTNGIFQTIGFKEFQDYLILSESERNSELGRKLYAKGLDDLKLVTRRYAKRQIKWIVNRFLVERNRQVPPLFELDVTHLELWDENVLNKSCEIIDHYLTEGHFKTCKHQPVVLRKNEKALQSFSESQVHFCDICERYFVGDQWKVHLKSNRHKKTVQAKRKKDGKIG